MTHIFQPLDLTVNGAAKDFLKAKFTQWFAKKIDEGLQEGKEIEDIEVTFGLTALKPLHASWVCDLYDYLTQARVRSQSRMNGNVMVSLRLLRKVYRSCLL